MRELLAAALTISLVLPTAAPALATVKNPDTFVYASIADPESFDPAWAYDGDGLSVIDNVYERLLAFEGAGTSARDLVPVLATKVPSQANGLISADGLTYRFPIRGGVKFHDGEVLTPDDVRYSLLRFMLLDHDGGPSSLLLEPILGLTSTRRDGRLVPGLWEEAAEAVTVDKDSVVVRLKRPFAPFLTIVAGFGAITERKWCAAHGQWDGEAASWEKFNNPSLEASLPKELMNGTGPFRLARFERGTRQLVLERNDAYWRKAAALKTVIIKVVDDFATRRLMIEAGDADVIAVPRMYVPQMQGLPGIETIGGMKLLERSMLMDFTFAIDPAGNGSIGSGKMDGEGVPPDFFADKDVRRAFAYAIDYAGCVQAILHGEGGQSAGLIPPGLIGYKAGPPRYAFDLKKSAEYFKKARGGQVWDKGFRFTIFFTTGNSAFQTLGQIIKKNVESLNPKFHVDVRTILDSTYIEQLSQRKIPLQLVSWSEDYPDPHDFIFPFLHSDGYFPTKQGYSNPRLDKLIEEAAHTLDESRRAALYEQIQDIADEDLPILPIVDGPGHRVQRAWVKGFVFKPAFPGMPEGSDYYDLRKGE